MKSTPSPDMPLAEFASKHYMTKAHHRSGRPPGKATFEKLRIITNHLEVILKRPPLVSDLTAANLASLEHHLRRVLRRRKVTIRQYDDTFRAILRFAADMGLIAIDAAVGRKSTAWKVDQDGKAIKLSEADGTLWSLCLNTYFPKKLKIRSDDTKKQYSCAIRDLHAYLGRDPTLSDLNDDTVIGLMKSMLEAGVAPTTVNDRKGRIVALWKWLAARRIVETFPTVENVKEPRRIPKAWNADELRRLIEACRHTGGKIGPVWASDFWVALHLVLWDTAERISATLAIRWEWIDFQTGDLLIPAEVRKGQESDAQYRLGANTLAAIQKLRHNGSELVFAMPNPANIHYMYKHVLRLAGLPFDRKSSFHRMRKSVASHLHAGGHNATDALGHRTADVTRGSYLDPAIAGAVRPSDVLFAIDDTADEVDFSIVPEVSPPLLGYRENPVSPSPGDADLVGMAWL